MLELDAKRKLIQCRRTGLSQTEAVQRIEIGLNGSGISATQLVELALEVYTSASIDLHLTDMGNAIRLVCQYGDIIRFCHERNRWLIWTGKVWQWDSGAQITELAKQTVLSIYREASLETDEDRRKNIAKHAARSESDGKIDAMINLAKSEPGIPISPAELDADPWLFNVQNGTLNLLTGILQPHRKEDLQSIMVPIEYNANAQCPLWQKFLLKVTGDNPEQIAYLQRAVGYSLTGNTKSQVLFFLYGLGNNGKSTFIAIVRKLTGEYGERVNTDLFMLKDKNASGPKEGLANLRGKRFVCASELEDGRRLAVSLIKDMTGGETIKADRKYEHEVEYLPAHKLWLIGNHKPVIADTTLSIWRRVKLIPFTVTIPNKEVDADLSQKLEGELSGILAWAVKGCLDWQKSGLNEPRVVTDATQTYRHESDILGDFLEDCCTLEPLATIPKSELKAVYQTWCADNGQEPIGQKTFRNRLTEKGVTEGRNLKVRYWHGLRLRNENYNTNDKKNGALGTNDKMGRDFQETPTREELQEKFIEKPVMLVISSHDKHDKTDFSCYACGGSDFWQRVTGEQVCSRCHPEPKQ